MGAMPQTSMTTEQYLDWCQHQGSDMRSELHEGEVIMMSPETNRHGRHKYRVSRAFDAAIEASGGSCEVWLDGVGIAIDDNTVREPDMAVQCTPADPDAVVIDNPVIVVEVLSPSTIHTDTTIKKDEYFRVPSIHHYLIVDPFNRLIVHHSREDAGGATSR
ncbi:MAG: Uma2 family endonuclease, partial [Pseudomonadota bacterium]